MLLQGALCASETTLPLRATAAAERLRRALADLSARFTRALPPTAELLGQGLHLNHEAIQLFSEEVRAISRALHTSFTACLCGMRRVEMPPWLWWISWSIKSFGRASTSYLLTLPVLAEGLPGISLSACNTVCNHSCRLCR